MEDYKEKTLSVLNDRLDIINKEIERLENPCFIDACNSIVINKERMLTLTTDEHSIVSYEFGPIHPTYFTPERARELQNELEIADCHGNKIELMVVGAKEYYNLLKEETLRYIDTVKRLFNEQENNNK